MGDITMVSIMQTGVIIFAVLILIAMLWFAGVVLYRVIRAGFKYQNGGYEAQQEVQRVKNKALADKKAILKEAENIKGPKIEAMLKAKSEKRAREIITEQGLKSRQDVIEELAKEQIATNYVQQYNQ